MKTLSLVLAFLFLAGTHAGLRAQSGPALIWSQQDPDATTMRAAIAYSPDDAFVASGREDDQNTKVWDAGTGAFVRTLFGRDNNANVIRFSPDSQYLATGTGGGGSTLNLNLWRVSDGVRLVGRIHAFNNGTIDLSFSADGQLLACAGFNANNYKIYHVPDMALVADVGNFDPDLGYNVRTNAVAFSPDGQLIALGDNRGVHLRRVADGSLVRILNTNGPASMKTNSVAFTPDGQYVAAGVHVVNSTSARCIDCAIKMFRVSDGALVRIFENGNNMDFPKIAFSPDGMIVGAAFSHNQANTGAVQFWDVNTGTTLQTDMFSLWPWDFAFSPLGDRYAFYSASGLFGVARAPSRVSPTPDPTATATPNPSSTPSATPPTTPTPSPTPNASPSASPTASPSPSPSPSSTRTPKSGSRVLNISTRMRVQGGDNVMIGGFIVAGTMPKKVIVRALGPSLERMGLIGLLSDPTLELRGESGALLAANDNWQENPVVAEEIRQSGVAPQNDREAAVVATLSPGSYTAVVSGKNGGAGTGLVEIYDLDQNADSNLANISTRGLVQSGDNVMIGGFVLGGTGENARVLIRAIGPSLTQFGIAGALTDPRLDLHDSNGALLVSNNNWRDQQETEIRQTGIAPTDDAEAAIVASLSPGAYTAVIGGSGDQTGVALVEVFTLK